MYTVGSGTAEEVVHKDYPTTDEAYAFEMAKKHAREGFTSYAMSLPGSSEWTKVDLSEFQVDRRYDEGWGRCYILARLPRVAIPIGQVRPLGPLWSSDPPPASGHRGEATAYAFRLMVRIRASGVRLGWHLAAGQN